MGNVEASKRGHCTWARPAAVTAGAVLSGIACLHAVNAAWERALFTPLCFVLAVLCAIVSRCAGDDRVATVPEAGR